MGPVLGAVTILLAVQSSQGMVVGTVRDEKTGQHLASAVVTLSDLDRSAAADSNGSYRFRQVPPGPHHITIRCFGYAPRSLQALVPAEGQIEINVSLRPEPIRLTTLDVRAPPGARVTGGGDASYPDRASSIAAVRDNPMLAEADVFLALAGGGVVVRPESPSGIHVRGGASDQTAYLLDGIPVFSPYHAAGIFSAWNPDALAELHLTSAAPSPENPDALSGTVAATTRTPGTRIGMQGSVSTSQARVTLDGPLGSAGAGYLVSLRAGLPGVLAPVGEATYLGGETDDALIKLELPAFGGRLHLVGYRSSDELDAAAAIPPDSGPSQAPARHQFAWRSRSLGAEWSGEVANSTVRVRGWSAAGYANATWASQVMPMDMSAARRGGGLLAALEHHSARSSTDLGVRVEDNGTTYRVSSDSSAGPLLGLRARTTVVTAFAQHDRALGGTMGLRVGASLAAHRGTAYLGPRVQLRWRPTDQVTFSGSYARAHQFAQSLRNAESVAGTVVPVDLFIGAGATGVPVARSDQGVLGAEYRPAAGVRFGIQAYARGLHGLLLVAPRDGGPFSSGAFTAGSGVARGVSVEAAVSAARFGLVASWAVQRVRLSYDRTSYTPEHGATHLLEGGLIVFPSGSLSLRLGATAALGRHATGVSGGLEWEACNLLDRGCEFSGSPSHDGAPPGGTLLPAFVRVDLGVRKNWHLRIGPRDAYVALFGTVTNLFDRKNVLTYARDSATGAPAAIEMRPRAPLVVGLDWRF